MDLGQCCDPGWGLVGAALGGFVEAEGLEGSGEGEEEQCWGDEGADVEVERAEELQGVVF